MIDANSLSKEEKVKRAEAAARLMQDPLLQEAFANLKLNYFEAWCACPATEVNERDRIFHCASVLNDVQTHLRVVITQGSIERAHINRRAATGS